MGLPTIFCEKPIFMILFFLAAVCAAAAAVIALRNRIELNRHLRTLNDMIDQAIDGTFTESTFDESVLSSMEAKLWQFLTSAETSSRKTAEEKEKIKTLIADIAHQTQTPISNIQLYSELLSEEELSENGSEYAERISQQSRKLDFLITSLVKMSRLETGIIALSPKQHSIVPMLDGIASEYEKKAAEKGLRFTADYPESSASFDEKWTAEAIANIVDNAIKYTDSGSVSITAREYEMFTAVEIKDTGAGIPEEEHPMIFQRFYRSERTSDREGVGVGLYLTREIISEQNGYIKVTSEPGKGTTFSVFLSK